MLLHAMFFFVFALCAQVFIVHGGLFSSDGVTLEDVEKIDRNREPPDSGKCTVKCC